MTIYWKFWENFRKFWENFRKFWKFFFRKLQEMHYFSIFFKEFNKHCCNFSRFGRKMQIVGKFWENFETFWWKFYRKIEIFIIFIFIFYFFRKFVTKNRAFGNNTIFLQPFFGFGGGISPLSTPWLRPCLQTIDNIALAD